MPATLPMQYLPSLLARWDSLPTSIDQYHVGTVVPGVVQRIKKFGVFLQVFLLLVYHIMIASI